MSEHRNFTRIPFDADTKVQQDNDEWSVDLIDISLNGVLFKQPQDWKIHPGKPVFIIISIAESLANKNGSTTCSYHTD